MGKFYMRNILFSLISLFLVSASMIPPVNASDADPTLDRVLSPLKYASIYEAFDALENRAKEAHQNSKYVSAAQLWEGMGLYAYALTDPSSKYYQKGQIVLDVGAAFSAEHSKQKELRARKTMGFKGAADSYFLAQNYVKAGEMWDQLAKHKATEYDSLTAEEARKAATSFKLAGKFDREIHYRYKVCGQGSTHDDSLDLAAALWKAKRDFSEPLNICWNVMESTKESNPAIYQRAYALFQENDPKTLAHFMRPEIYQKLREQRQLAEAFKKRLQEDSKSRHTQK